MVFLKEFFKKVDFETKQQITKKHEKFLRRQRINFDFDAIHSIVIFIVFIVIVLLCSCYSRALFCNKKSK